MGVVGAVGYERTNYLYAYAHRLPPYSFVWNGKRLSITEVLVNDITKGLKPTQIIHHQ
jgi:hypothetical protein